MIYDVAIIGAGIIGCSLARELSETQCKTVIIEKENDVAMGSTRANSAIIHAGYDPKPGTLMAKYNAEGCRLTAEICEELNVPFRRCGSFVLAFEPSEADTLKELLEYGKANGVPGIEILSGEEVRKMEPNVSENCIAGLWAPSSGIVNPWELCLALAENAVYNGADLLLDYSVSSIEKEGDIFIIRGKDGRTTSAKFVVNAAGTHCDEIAAMVGDKSFSVDCSLGQYFVLDKSQGSLFNSTMFQCPGPLGKGVLVSPTVHGNLLVGPDANPGSEKDYVGTSRAGLEKIAATSKKTTLAANLKENIRNFAGVRCEPSTHDFIIGFSAAESRFMNIAGIKSPGLSSAAAIAKDVAKMLFEAGVPSEKNENYRIIKRPARFNELSYEEKAAIVKENPSFGKIVCRCEVVTEGEMINALHGVIVPRSLDGIKRRCGSGMGRCQGGFCSPKVLEIVARELGIDPTEVLLDKTGSFILSAKTRKGGEDNVL